VLGRQGRRGGRGDDHIHLGAHELGREPGKLIRLGLGEPALDDHGPPFDPKALSNSLGPRVANCSSSTFNDPAVLSIALNVGVFA
jgi:hypothetical protein